MNYCDSGPWVLFWLPLLTLGFWGLVEGSQKILLGQIYSYFRLASLDFLPRGKAQSSYKCMISSYAYNDALWEVWLSSPSGSYGNRVSERLSISSQCKKSIWMMQDADSGILTPTLGPSGFLIMSNCIMTCILNNIFINIISKDHKVIVFRVLGSRTMPEGRLFASNLSTHSFVCFFPDTGSYSFFPSWPA